ncbi:MAG: hypothetical protein HPY53_07570 [Brevinematales bacterium]|nr:hypothetical protein [Brevinematales bacterium]
MKRFEWSKNLITGSMTLDIQNRFFLDLINKMSDELENNPGISLAKKYSTALLTYFICHCMDEEYMMRQYFYPGYVIHSLKHREIKKRFFTCLQRDSNQNRELLELLISIWNNHMLVDDLDFNKHLSGHF